MRLCCNARVRAPVEAFAGTGLPSPTIARKPASPLGPIVENTHWNKDTTNAGVAMWHMRGWRGGGDKHKHTQALICR
eukprot:15035896-Alexandrium_andersonii.AAC.1